MGWSAKNQAKDNAKNVQRWWAISNLGRQLKVKEGKNPDLSREGKSSGHLGEGGKELEVILLSNREPTVEHLMEETEVFCLLETNFNYNGVTSLLCVSYLVSGDIFHCKVVTVRRGWWCCLSSRLNGIKEKREKCSSQDQKQAQNWNFLRNLQKPNIGFFNWDDVFR